MTTDNDDLLQSVLTLANQVKRLAEHQAILSRQLHDLRLVNNNYSSTNQQQALSTVHFPSPSIVDMAVVESPFLFHDTVVDNQRQHQQPHQQRTLGTRHIFRHH